MDKSMISIVVPVHNMESYEKFLKRNLDSIAEQTFTNYEVIIPDNSTYFARSGIEKIIKKYDFRVNHFLNNEHGMAQNTNAGIRAAKGKMIKILYMDDYLAHKDALKNIKDVFTKGWMVTACDNDQGTGHHEPHYNNQIHTGNNTIGSPSVLTFENRDPLMFDEKMTWLLDCDYYKRLQQRYGMPAIYKNVNVIIGVGEHQITNKLSQEDKLAEGIYMEEKYESN